MSTSPDFSAQTIAGIATWHAVSPPNATALRMVADLEKVIADFTALRGTLAFEDEPSSFQAALLAAAAVETAP